MDTKMIFNDNSVALLFNGNQIIFSCSDQYFKGEYINYYQDNKADYGVEDLDFLNPLVFIGDSLHSIQQWQSNFLFINGVEIIGAVNMEDTGGDPVELYTKVNTSQGILEIKDLIKI